MQKYNCGQNMLCSQEKKKNVQLLWELALSMAHLEVHALSFFYVSSINISPQTTGFKERAGLCFCSWEVARERAAIFAKRILRDPEPASVTQPGWGHVPTGYTRGRDRVVAWRFSSRLTENKS